MPFTNYQTTQFLTSNAQMALSDDQRAALATEGLSGPDDFDDFHKDELKAAFKNCRAHDPAVPIPAKCTSRLLIASVAYSYYTDTGRAVTSTNMHYRNVLKDFHTEWKAIQKLSEKDTENKLPVLSKSCPPLKWCESMKHHLSNTFGVRDIPLSYIIRESVNVTPEPPAAPVAGIEYDPLQPGKAYGNSGSVLGDLVARSSHTHPLYKTDNAHVFSLIEQAARSSVFLSTIRPFENTKNGRGAWLAIVTAHVGKAKWDHIQKENNKWLINSQWTGKKYALETFCSQHRAKFQQLQEASTHVQFQVPTEHTRVGYLIDSIQCDDAGLQAALAQVRNDHDGSRSDFEKAVGLLIPMDPYAANQATKDSTKVTFAISSAEAGSHSKNGRGAQTGVDLRWHTKEEFAKLSSAEKKELQSWQGTPEGKAAVKDSRAAHFKEKKRKDGDGDKKSQKKLKARIASLEKAAAEKKEEEDQQSRLAEIAAALDRKSSRSHGANASSATSDSLSIAREIMGIVARSGISHSTSGCRFVPPTYSPSGLIAFICGG